jgi:hypothetical protein
LLQVHRPRSETRGLRRGDADPRGVNFTKGRIIVRGKLVARGKAKRADYILYYKPNIPIAIIEAKDNDHSTVARRVPIQIEQSNAADWIEATLVDGVCGIANVVYHSIVWQYLSDADRGRFKRVITAAGRAATHHNPLAWLRFEPGDNLAEVRLQWWPGGEDRLLARSGFHGRPVHWLRTDT